MNKYYKVVRELGGYRHSCSAQGKAVVLYSDVYFATPPEWLKEKGYGLCVFDDLDLARKFTQTLPLFSWETIEVWEVEVRDKLPNIYNTYLCSLKLLKKGRLSPTHFDWPTGTKMFGQVKLTKRVLKKYYDHSLGTYIIKKVK